MAFVDANVPANSAVRSDILSFLSEADVLEAAEVNDAWFQASTSWEVWRPKFERNEFVKPTLEGGSTYHFAHPLMYRFVLEAVDDKVKESFNKCLEEDAFYDGIGQVIGHASERHKQQFPMAEILSRHPKVIAMALDQTELEEFPPVERCHMIVANVARWHFVDPRVEDIPWMQSLFALLLLTSHEYIKQLAAAGVYMLKPKTRPSVMSDDDVRELMKTNRAAIDRHFQDKTKADGLADDRHPRQLYSLYFYVKHFFPHLAEEATAFVRDHHGEAGIAELKAAEERVRRLWKEEEDRQAAKRQEHADNLAKIRAGQSLTTPDS